VTLLLLLAPSTLSFVLLLSMARYERWALDSNEGSGGAGAAGRPFPAGAHHSEPRPREAERQLDIAD
jgi:hypothetical protein